MGAYNTAFKLGMDLSTDDATTHYNEYKQEMVLDDLKLVKDVQCGDDTDNLDQLYQDHQKETGERLYYDSMYMLICNIFYKI